MKAWRIEELGDPWSKLVAKEVALPDPGAGTNSSNGVTKNSTLCSSKAA